MPATHEWSASTLDDEHCLTGTRALRRFVTTPEATQVMAGPARGVPAAVVRAPVHATLWRSLARPG